MSYVDIKIDSYRPYIQLIDNAFNVNITKLLHILASNFNNQYGFNYDLESKIDQFYSNVHATVLINLYLAELLAPDEVKICQDVLFNLRDKNPRQVFSKDQKDKYAWDTIEGPNVFSTALSSYALLLTQDERIEDIANSINWLMEQRNNRELWPATCREDINNYVATFYSILALRMFYKKSNSKRKKEKIEQIFDEVKSFVEKSFVSINDNVFVTDYHSRNISLSNTIVSLYLLHLLKSEKLTSLLNDARNSIEDVILNSDQWYISVLSDTKTERIKTMYTYNPAYLMLLLRLGWSVSDKIIVKMLFWIIDDLRSFWNRKNIIYPWRSSDSVIQSFICSLSIQSLFFWIKSYLNQKVKEIQQNIDVLFANRDVFLCHASADKERYVNKLYQELKRAGISVWYDEGEIIWGDYITEKIEEGIKNSQFAIICLSDNFLKTQWPYSEFTALFQRQQSERRKIILPLILNSKEKIMETYPLIRNIHYEEWEKGPDYLVSRIKKILKCPTHMSRLKSSK